MSKKVEQTHRFWGETKFYCPHCKSIFKYKEMWKIIAEDYKSIDKIMKALNRSLTVVRAAVAAFGLELEVNGTNVKISWNRRAKKLGYKNARELFYDLRVVKRMGYSQISKLVNREKEQTKKACLSYLK